MCLDPAPGRLLVASPALLDDNFHRTVVLICRYHHELGTVGLVLNRPTAVKVGKVLPQVAEGRGEPLWIGGPVDGRTLWTLHRRADLQNPGEEILEGVWFGAEGSLIRKVLATNDPDEKGELFRLFVGYAGWGSGQLENELEAGAWRVVPAGSPALFSDAPGCLWDEMMLRSILPCSREPELLLHCGWN